MTLKFKPIKQKKLSEEISDQIKELILKGEFKPGDKLPPERNLAGIFSVSRPPVREAINALTAMGFLEKHHGEGTIVKSIVSTKMGDPFSDLILHSKEKVTELIEVRKGIESWTSYYAALRRTEEEVVQFDEIIKSMEDSFEAGKTSEEEDSRLHITIARATHNVIWLHMMHTIFDVMQEFLNLIWQKVYPDTEDRAILLKQHRGIVDAIKNSNSQDAYERMLEHLSFAEQKTLAFLSRNSVHDLLP